MKHFSISLSLFLILSSISNSNYPQSLSHLIHMNLAPAVVDNKLDLSNLHLSDLRGISEYPNINKVEILILRDNKLKSIQALSSLSKYNIKMLDLACNSIKDLSPLSKLSLLEELYIEGNLIAEETLQNLISKLTSLITIVVDANPIKNPVYKQYEKKFKNINFVDIYNQEFGEQIYNIKIYKLNEPEEDQFCSICGIEDDQEDLYLTECQHVFHKNCLKRWFKFCTRLECKLNCPICRLDFLKH